MMGCFFKHVPGCMFEGILYGRDATTLVCVMTSVIFALSAPASSIISNIQHVPVSMSTLIRGHANGKKTAGDSGRRRENALR